MVLFVEKPSLRSPERQTPRHARPRCGARCRDGSPCRAPVVWDRKANRPRNRRGPGRCRRHGGLSTGPNTPEGKARIAAAQRKRWAEYRRRKAEEATQIEAEET